MHQEQLDDEERFRFILKMTTRLKDIEDQFKSTLNPQGSTFYGQNGLMSSNPSQPEEANYVPQLITFKPIKES